MGWTAVVGALAAIVMQQGGTQQAPAPPVAMFAGGPAHTGVSAARPLAVPGRVRWSLRMDGPVRSSPVIAGGSVWVGGGDGALYRVRLSDGHVVWRHDLGRPVQAAPAVDDQTVYAVDVDGAISAVGRDDGALRWHVRVGPALPWAWGGEGWDYLGSSPVVVGHTLVAGAGDGVVRAVDTRSGEVLWSVATGGRVRSSPAVADGVVYVGSADGIVRALRLEDGSEVWSFRTEGHTLDSAAFGFDRRTVTGGPTVVGDRVLVGSRDARMYALDRATGRTLWAEDDSSSAWVIATPAVVDGRVIFGRSSSAKVQALSLVDGALLWEAAAGALVFSSATVAGGTAFLTTGGGALLALDAATGERRWSRRLDGPSWTTPALADGVLVVGTDAGTLLALEEAEAGQPRVAVFQDSTLFQASITARRGIDTRLARQLTARGHERLDRAGLVRFLEERTRDGAPSAVVMATDVIPPELLEPGPDTGPLRQYLERGGRIVWVGDPPRWALWDPEAQRFGLDIVRAREVTDVDHAPWVSDARVHRPTPAGVAWGLEGWWIGPGGVDPTAVTTVLASDEEGRAAAWVKSFGGPPGSGWVWLPVATEERLWPAVARVAEAGILVAF
ncbi:MAG: PQQ-binding-like beta-propeller repeat protein [Gemmatimonadota bacterium]